MTWLMTLVAVAIVTAAGLGVAARVLARRYASPSRADEVEHAATRDGWRIALHHYRARAPLRAREPVLLCHGLLSNRASLDLDGDVSLACFLRDAGFDVWVMELRARGASYRAARPRDVASRMRLGFDWTLDEFIREDLPAAVRHVLSETGSGSLHWVGHSLGGMILCAHAAAGGEMSWFRSAVALDSPVRFAPLKMITWPARLFARGVPFVPILLFKPIFTLAYHLVPESALVRAILLDRSKLLKIMHNGLVDYGSSRVLLHLASILAEGRFRSFDRSVDYEEGPAGIRFPLMVLRAAAGRNPEACVRHLYDASPAPVKEYVRCGRAEGFEIDHNHFTLVIGNTAAREIFPLIAGWVARHSAGGADERYNAAGGGT
jgi:pimeloyl-ACP methyl ester carboxylesterase